MKKHRYLICTNAGGIKEVKEQLENGTGIRCATLDEVFAYLITESRLMYGGRSAFGLSELSIRYAFFDERIGLHVFKILTDRYLKERYKTPQFIRWLYCLKEYPT